MREEKRRAISRREKKGERRKSEKEGEKRESEKKEKERREKKGKENSCCKTSTHLEIKCMKPDKKSSLSVSNSNSTFSSGRP